ncbi:MAG: potassium transporter TrkA [Gammaproteobacteria bacterium HGW-Gammaproteobacteria-8]|nr:MAG: potassium transporter TrkA [Gammaproteobacteria bacterium HGW-Gammaproteobacteria-8]
MRTDSLLFLFFRRMRVPLIVLITAYAIAVAGFTLMPGVDDQGRPWRMSLFEAFYVVSYTGSTIGFGEVPYPFSSAQRMWTVISIYLTVIAWLFSIGSIIALLQDPAFAQTLRRARLARNLRRIQQPFYLVCGYGDTGRLLVSALTGSGHPVVVIDPVREKIETLEVEDLGAAVTSFAMDAARPENLVQAGLRSRWCAGVIAVTGDDQTNLRVALAARLLNHSVSVHARANQNEVAANLRSFDTNSVIRPVEEFARRLELALHKPDLMRLYTGLFSGPNQRPIRLRSLPEGRWIVCGWTAVGRVACELLRKAGREVVLIDPDADRAERPPGYPDRAVAGSATEADILQAAGIDHAVGLIAAAADDADNLSTVMTARQLLPELYVIALENGHSMHPLYRAAGCDLIAEPAVVVAGAMLGRIRSSLVEPFIEQMLAQDNTWARAVLARLWRQQRRAPPEISAGRISARRAPALVHALQAGRRVTVGDLLRDPRRRDRMLPVTLLLLRREGEDLLLPDADTELQVGDRLLLAGRSRAAARLQSVLEADGVLEYILTGQRRPQGWIWRRLSGLDERIDQTPD